MLEYERKVHTNGSGIYTSSSMESNSSLSSSSNESSSDPNIHVPSGKSKWLHNF